MGHFYFLFNLLVGAEIGYGDMYLTSTLEYVRNKVKSKIGSILLFQILHLERGKTLGLRSES